MPESGSSGPHQIVVGTAQLSRLPSSVPVAIVPDHVLAATAGPVPVLVRRDAHSVSAWAWAERAWAGAKETSYLGGEPEDPPTFSLSRLALERLGPGTEAGTVELAIPAPTALTPVLPLVHDIPGNDEIQVHSDVTSEPCTQLMVRNGVAAWVMLVPRDHVRPGTVRISNHLRAITGPVAAATADPNAVFFRPVVDEPGRAPERRVVAAVRSYIRSATERGLRWFFLAPEQSMRVAPAHPDDEHQHIVTLQDVALSRLGVRSGDNVILRWGSAEVEVAAVSDHDSGESGPADGRHDPTKPGLARDMPPHLAVRVPTALRHMIDLPAASVVTVRRSTRSVLARNLNSLVIPVASLALAGAALNDPNWALLACGAVTTAVLGLSRLRMGSRRATRLHS